ncbi:MAG: M20/M25/M40 family metallo-hydrolase, partial [Gammaproteobacteria bacterium]
GTLRAPVVYVKTERLEDLEAYRGKLKGAIVITAATARRADAAAAPGSPGTPGQPPAGQFDPRRSEELRQAAQKRQDFFKAEGVAALLSQSNKEYGLLSMGGSGGRDYRIAAFPGAVLTRENFSLLHRLLQRGRVEVELEIVNSIRPGPIEVHNTVAEIRGSEKPDEVVVLGAHLDSWDLGTGTNDNATGSSVILEAARALKTLGLRPKRTIRFILFSGEEQGLVGAREYVKAHKSDLDKFSAVLVHDTGTGRVNSIGLSGHYQLRETMDKVVAPLRAVGLQELSMRRMGGSDHMAFDEAGVPGFDCIQERMDYMSHTHHSQVDTFERARKDDLVQGAQVVAVWTWRVAQLPELLPRKPKPAVSATTSGT